LFLLVSFLHKEPREHDKPMNAPALQLDQTLIADAQSSGEPQHWALGLEVQVVDFLSGYTVSGTLEGFTPGEVTVVLPEMISEQRTVTVRLNSFLFGGETLYCRPADGGYEAHITIDDVEENGLRRAPRFPVRIAGYMFQSHGAPVAITIVEISGEGLGIDLPVALEAGQPVAIANASVFLFAIVKCCSVREAGFRAWVEMQHLFEKAVEAPCEEPRGGLLGKVFSKRLVKRAVESGAPGGTRTPGLLVRSQSLYPAELRARLGWSRSQW
jgi:hypothetical protein